MAPLTPSKAGTNCPETLAPCRFFSNSRISERGFFRRTESYSLSIFGRPRWVILPLDRAGVENGDDQNPCHGGSLAIFRQPCPTCSYQLLRRKLALSEGKMKATELFVIVALILLVFALVARFFGPSGLGIAIIWRGAGYGLPPSFICITLATMLCFFASIYSLWMLPFNRAATWWHFSLTTIGIGVFWLAFYRVPNSRTAVWAAFAAPAAILLTQVIFVWNFIQAIVRMPRMHS